jgi:hypothetical protein
MDDNSFHLFNSYSGTSKIEQVKMTNGKVPACGRQANVKSNPKFLPTAGRQISKHLDFDIWI